MAHIKVIPPRSFDERLYRGEPAAQLLKMASAGLRGNDFRDFVKRAGHSFANLVRGLDLKPGDIPVHVIALGATEFYGPNRNGDGFKEATCRRCHNSFVKFARWYRNHDNKNPAKSYGFIKHSEFNEEMKRIELLAILNGTKEAADRNGGLLADEELKLLNSDSDIPTSMACKVAHDVCAGCGNRAKNRSEYCTGVDEGGMCKRGGVKNRMCLVHDDGFINHVDNPDPMYFDNSKVFRGADRIAWTNGVIKTASGAIIGGSELAERLGLELPTYLAEGGPIWSSRLQKLATKLAHIESFIGASHSLLSDRAFSPDLVKPVDWSVYSGLKKQAYAALMLFKIVPPMDGWVKLAGITASDDTIQAAKMYLPGIYSRLVSSNTLTENDLRDYIPCGTVSSAMMKWAADLAEDYSIDVRHVETRSRLAALYNIPTPAVKQAPLIKIAGAAETIAREYALYKLAFLQALEDKDEGFELTCQIAIRNNYIQR